MENEETQSPAMQLLSLVWEHKQAATGHSWLKINHAMSDALKLAICSGMNFAEDDFRDMARFRPGYWRHIENCYRYAVVYRNAAAWKAIEKFLGRKPFIVKGASIHIHTGDGPAGQGLARLVVGAEFKWDGKPVKVTSLNDENGYAYACYYKPWTEEDEDKCPTCDKPRQHRYEYTALKRYKITHADIAASKKKSE